MTAITPVRLTLLLLSTASALRAPLPRPTVRPVVFPELTSHPLMTVESPSAQSVEKAMNRVQDLGWTFAVAGWVVVGTAWFSIASIREMSSAQAAADVPVVLLAVVALLAAVESATAVPPGRAAQSCELAHPHHPQSDEWVRRAPRRGVVARVRDRLGVEQAGVALPLTVEGQGRRAPPTVGSAGGWRGRGNPCVWAPVSVTTVGT